VLTKRRAVVLVAVIGLLAISGMAMAADHFDENDDGVFNFGSDSGPDAEFLFWNITSLEYGDDDFEWLYESCALEDDGSFEYTFEDDTLDLTGYTSEDCGPFQGGDVTADGHPYNHGAYMSFFNSMYEGSGRGCLNHHLAQSDLGKDVDLVPGEIDFQTVAVDCQHGKKSAAERGPHSQTTGQAKWGDEKPGKSGDAPGHNK